MAAPRPMHQISVNLRGEVAQERAGLFEGAAS